jgi:flagellar protein FliS
MESNELKSFTARITQANRSELVVIVYEIIEADIASAMKAYEIENYELFSRELNHAVKFVNELINGLDFEYVISYDLLHLYLFVNKQIISASVSKSIEPLEGASKVLASLKTGFEGVAKQDHSASVMSNTQQVYAGLTYTKGSLNEMYVDPNHMSRGFKA